MVLAEYRIEGLTLLPMGNEAVRTRTLLVLSKTVKVA
jgi:hypothetical protein